MFRSKKREHVQYSEAPDNQEQELTSDNLRKILGKSADILFQVVYLCGDRRRYATIIFTDGLVDQKSVGDSIIKPLTQKALNSKEKTDREMIDLLAHGLIYSPAPEIRTHINDAILDILSGSCIIVFDDAKTAVTFQAKRTEHRSITEPTSENTAKGAKDCFVESLRVNTATVRSRIKTQNLIIEETTVGRQTLTGIGLVYIDGIANQGIVDEVKKRLNSIEIDGVLTSGFIEEYIIDKRCTAFPQILATERPDKFCTSLLDGRVGLLIDGLPIAYEPAVLFHFLRQSMTPLSRTPTVFFSEQRRLLPERSHHRVKAAALRLFCPYAFSSCVLYRHYDLSSGNDSD
jgi:spore germination protein KA